MDLNGKHVLITGAAKRVARSIAERFLDYDIRLTIHYRHSEMEARELEGLAKGRGRQAALLQGDLRETARLESLVTRAEAALGPIDVLVNSASSFYPTPAGAVTEAQWDDLMNVNLKAHFFLSQAVAARMPAGGVILNLADVNGERAMAGYTPYVISKAGLLMMTRNLAKELAPRVRVNSISPGAVLLPESYTEAQKEKSVAKTLLGRLGSPGDIAEGALFLVANDYVTGFDLKIDGGRSLV